MSGSGLGTTLRYPASGRWHHAQQTGSGVHWVWGQAADVLIHGSMRTHLPLGNPLIALRFEDAVDATNDTGNSKGVAIADAIQLSATPVSTEQVTVVACAPGAPGLDTLAVLRYLAAALDEEAVAEGPPTWQDFVSSFSALEQPLRILEPGGSPATGRSIRLSGGPGPVTLDSSHHGDALAALGVTRAALGGRTLDVRDGDSVIASSAGTAFPDGLVPVTSSSTGISVASIEHWLSEQQATSTSLQRFTRGNVVKPFADGVATFADLFVELNRAVVDDRPDPADPAKPKVGAFYVTGYSLQHAALLGPETDATPLRSVQDVAEAMAAAGGDPKFLTLQMLQLDPDWLDDAQRAAAIAALILCVAGAAGAAGHTGNVTDQATFFLHAEALAIALFFGSASLASTVEGFELNRDAIVALDALAGVQAYLDPVDADVADNPRAQTSEEIIDLALDAQRRFNVFHQKIQVVRNAAGIHAYCGGIDLNANRTQTPAHASRSPFHDVHARVDGPAAGELATTFIERWRRAAPTPPIPPIPESTPPALGLPGALDGLPETGSDIVQVARTYYRPVAGSGRGLSFAPLGESTILETLVSAIGRARRYIYVEDQYLTPPQRFTEALADAAATVSGPLVIVVPASPDQPFGLPRRQAFIQDMRSAWGSRVKVGILRKRFSHSSTSLTSATGRLWLGAELDEGADIVELGPGDRFPSTPFWITVGGEAMRAYQKVAGFSAPTTAQFHVERGDASRLFGLTSGTDRKKHKLGAAAIAGSFPSIYVHTKMMLIDDAFASIGSANANRRGYYSDGECNIFAMREEVADGDNWMRDLRIALWAEHLGITPEYASAALIDPASGLSLFDRKFTVGNRFTTFDAQSYATDLSLATEFTDKTSALGGVAMVAKFVGGMAAAIAGLESDDIFDTVIDPSSEIEFP